MGTSMLQSNASQYRPFISSFCDAKDEPDMYLLRSFAFKGLTPCFEEVVILGSLHIAMIVCCTLRLWQLFSRHSLREKIVSHQGYRAARLVCCLVALICPILQLNGRLGAVESSTEGSDDLAKGLAPYEKITFPTTILAWLLATIVVFLENYKWIKTNGMWIMRFVFSFAWACSTIKLYFNLKMEAAQKSYGYFAFIFFARYIAVAFLGTTWILFFPKVDIATRRRPTVTDEDTPLLSGKNSRSSQGALSKGQEAPDSFDKRLCPEDTANVFSVLMFSWMSPLMKLGFQRPLEDDDIWELNRRDKATTLYARFVRYWTGKRERTSGADNLENPQPSLFHAVGSCFGLQFSLAGVAKLFNDASQFTGPYFLNKIVTFNATAEQRGVTSNMEGYMYAFAIFISAIVGAIGEGIYFQRTMRVGMQIRSALSSVVFKKVMSLSPEGRAKQSSGKISNILSSDVEAVQSACQDLHMLWSAPLRITIALIMLYDLIGAATYVGAFFLVVAIPAQKKVMEWQSSLMRESLKKTDARVSISTEVLSSMNVVKMYAWEQSFLKKIFAARDEEKIWLKKIGLVGAVGALMMGAVPILVSVASLTSFVLMPGVKLTPAIAFTSLALFGVLRMQLFMFPNAINQIVRMRVSLGRIEELLSAEELEESEVLANDGAKPAIEVNNGTFFWSKSETFPTLRNISFSVEKGSLVAVIGATAQGKSSLLSACLGEMISATGDLAHVAVRGKIAYVPQQSWIFNATIRENILFGEKFDIDRYRQAIEVSGLKEDIRRFSAGDQTEIGEKGVNLSGGQKQRVSLARAVYSDADVYLFDDPLSALDAHVAREVNEKCINRYLKGRTRLLVTNRVEYIEHVDSIILMKDGRIEAKGKFKELTESSEDFSRIMKELSANSEGDASGDRETVTISQNSRLHDVMSTDTASEAPSARLEEAARPHREDKVKNSGLVVEQEEASMHGPDDGTKMIKEEHRERGSISWTTVSIYIVAVGGYIVGFTVVCLFLFGEFCRLGSSYWVSLWSADSLHLSIASYIAGYALWSFLQAALQFVTQVYLAITSIKGGQNLHKNMLICLMRSPIRFFDTTPIGRIISRITKDMDDIDRMMLLVISYFLRGVISLLGTLLMIGCTTYYAIAAFVPILCLFYWVQRYYQASARELKRLQSITRSPLYAHFTQCFDGLASIRAYGAGGRMFDESMRKLDRHIRFDLVTMSANRWLSLRLECLGGLMVLASAGFAVAMRHALGPQTAGLSLSYALQITGVLNMCVRLASMAENSFNAVERVDQYTKLEPEAPETVEPRPRSNWPKTGTLNFEHVAARYRPGLPLVLKDLHFSVQDKEKVGIVGRTGAGKSSLLLVLFRMMEPSSGRILLDGQDISKLGLRDLRSRLSIIPQDPVIFSGTLRSNLDPFEEHSDKEIWEALEKARIKKLASEHPEKLMMVVKENGEQFSVGQRQLVCLARALLRKARVLVLDEATAAVDIETDSLIQSAIRIAFVDCTMLTIAHRLNTIIDSDKVLVINAGMVAEYDTPQALLERSGSVFGEMVDSTGPGNARLLRQIARGEVSFKDMLQESPKSVDGLEYMRGSIKTLRHTKSISSLRDVQFETAYFERLRQSLVGLRMAIEEADGEEIREILGKANASSGEWAKELHRLIHELSRTADRKLGEMQNGDGLAMQNATEVIDTAAFRLTQPS